MYICIFLVCLFFSFNMPTSWAEMDRLVRCIKEVYNHQMYHKGEQISDISKKLICFF